MYFEVSIGKAHYHLTCEIIGANTPTIAINKQSKSAYFRERCDGGPKKQSFWKTIKPHVLDKTSFNTSKIILQEEDSIVNDTGEICKIFNCYFTCVANNIGFDDTIPTDYYTDVGFSSIINKYCWYPSIVKINENTLNKTLFQFERIHSQDVVKIINCFDCKIAKMCKIHCTRYC